MNARDEQLNETIEVAEVLAAEPIIEAAVSDIAEVVPGCVVAVEIGEDDSPVCLVGDALEPDAGAEEGEQPEQIPPHRNGRAEARDRMYALCGDRSA